MAKQSLFPLLAVLCLGAALSAEAAPVRRDPPPAVKPGDSPTLAQGRRLGSGGKGAGRVVFDGAAGGGAVAASTAAPVVRGRLGTRFDDQNPPVKVTLAPPKKKDPSFWDKTKGVLKVGGIMLGSFGGPAGFLLALFGVFTLNLPLVIAGVGIGVAAIAIGAAADTWL